MGTRGPLPKDSRRRQGHHKPKPKAEVVEPPVIPAESPRVLGRRLADEPPAPPAGLLKATREEWEVFWRDPVAQAVTLGQLPELERLFEYRDERRRCLRVVRSTRIEEVAGPDGEPTLARVSNRLVPGSKGQAVANPLLAYIVRLEQLIRPLEDRFGLNPAAQIRLADHLGGILRGVNRTLQDLNRQLADDDDDPDDDPRLAALRKPDPDR